MPYFFYTFEVTNTERGVRFRILVNLDSMIEHEVDNAGVEKDAAWHIFMHIWQQSVAGACRAEFAA